MSSEYLTELPPMRSVQPPRSFEISDVVTTAIRHRRLLAYVFGAMLLIAVLAAVLLPPLYETRIQILVKSARLDPVVSAGANVNTPQPNEAEMEQALNSEAELLKSNDLLEHVVIAIGLDRSKSMFGRAGDHPLAIAVATRKLGRHLRVQALAKTNIVEATYRSFDPKIAAQVLNTLAALYLQKHIELHQAPGQYTFFSQLAEEYRKQMDDSEARIVASGQVAPGLLRDMTAQKYNDANATFAQTKAAIEETEKRIAGLQMQQKATPPRVITAMHRIDNQMLLQQMKSTLLNLQLKRTELLTKFQPTYRLVREVDQQISDTQAAIEKEQSSPARDETSDANPIYSWVDSELAKAKAELVGLKARQAATDKVLRGYEDKLKELQQDSMTSDSLQRSATTAKENYLLYSRKAEEARVSEALDKNRILNVVLAESASVPLLPQISRLDYFLIGVLIALLGTVVFLVGAYFFDSHFYCTPEQLQRSLDLPVLAVLPAPALPGIPEKKLLCAHADE